MTLFKAKNAQDKSNLSLDEQMKEVAKKHGITLADLKKLAEGKKCPIYGTKELLHVRKARGGKLVVFNISEKHRGEKISLGRKNLSKKRPKKRESN
ncbi:hypothetical protein OAT67_08425 [Bacteriovoracaceae bacterium]|nr:hypothetical protein [Bacteriovoracaceae bacterium]